MRNIYVLFALLTVTVGGFCQCYNGITTNPDNTNWPSNIYDQPYKKNTGSNLFDWRQQHIPVSMANTSFSNYNSLVNPFWQTPSSDHLYGIVAFSTDAPTKADFQPLNGWELIKRDFGYLSDGTHNTNESRVGPYFILYNRFSSKLRIFGYLPEGDAGFSTINVTLKFRDNTQRTGLFLNYTQNQDIGTTVARPMDQPTVTNTITASVKAGGADNIPFFADFQLAYDPCTCNLTSDLEVDFQKLQTMSVNLYGKVLGASTPISVVNAAGVTDYKNYLTSVYAPQNADQSFQVKAGMVTYTNIQNMYNDYVASAAQAARAEKKKAGLEILKTVLEVGAALATDGASTAAFALEAKSGLEAAAAISDFFVSQAGDGTKDALPSVITGEMALTGQIVNNVPSNGSTISFANPGSLGSSSAPECCTPGDYPMYNEVLGTFALLNTPSIDRYVSSASASGGQIKLNQASIAYKFNPAMKINPTKTQIYGALEIRVPTTTPYDPSIGMGVSSDFFYQYSYTTAADATPASQSFMVGSTPFLPIKSLSTLTPTISGGTSYHALDVNSNNLLKYVFLKLMVIMESTDLNTVGVPNRSVLILTYPMKINSTTIGLGPLGPEIGDFASLPAPITDCTDNGNCTTTTPDEQDFAGASDSYKVWYEVTISGKLVNTTPSSPTVITAGSSITISPGGIVGPGFDLKAADPISLDRSIAPLSDQQTQTFCGGAYRASSSARVAASKNVVISNSVTDEIHVTTNAYPNPAGNRVTFQYYVEEPSYVTLQLKDIEGSIIATPVDAFQEAGNHELTYETGTLSPGVYLYSIETSKGKQIKRLIVIK